MRLLSVKPSEVPGLLRKGKIRVAVIGLGHVGLPLALLLASNGAMVEGCDANGAYLNSLRRGVSPIVEHSGSKLAKRVLSVSCPNCGVRLLSDGREDFCPNCFKVADLHGGSVRLTDKAHGAKSKEGQTNEMQELLKQALKEKRLTFTQSASVAAHEADATIIAVGTPIDSEHQPDLSALRSACEAIGSGLKKGSMVVLKSTVSPGTTEDFVRPILEVKSGLKAGRDFGLAHVPETTLEGLALLGYRTLPKTVGGIDKRSSDLAAALFSILGAPVHVFEGPRITESAKLFQNIYRDVNIALANELALSAEKLGVDVTKVIEAALTEPKTHLLTPGPGAGGYCLPKDTYYLTSPASKLGFKPNLLFTAREVNSSMPKHVADLVRAALEEKGLRPESSRAAILGLAFKGNTADTRDSPSLEVVKELSQMGLKMDVHDPLADFGSLKLPELVVNGSKSLSDVLRSADVLVLLTDHLEYRSLHVADLKKLAPRLKAVVDARHVLPPGETRALGYSYKGVGRGGY